MKKSEIARLLRNRTKTLSIRINPDLLKLLEEALKEDHRYKSKTELIEEGILRYLEERGKL